MSGKFNEDLDTDLNKLVDDNLFNINFNDFDFSNVGSNIDIPIKDSNAEEQRKSHNLYESKITKPEEAMKSTNFRIGNPIYFEKEDDSFGDDEKSGEFSQLRQSKQDFVLIHREHRNSGIGESLEDNSIEPDDNVEVDEPLEIAKPIKRDLVLVRSKFSERKEDSFSWSMEALGYENKEKVKGTEKEEKSKKKEKKEEGNLPICKLIIVGIIVIFVFSFIIMNATGTSITIMTSHDMYPTLSTSGFYKTKIIKDYNVLKYMDIVLYEINGEKIPSRVIGFPGDNITIRRFGVYINDEQIDPEMIGGEYDFRDLIREADNGYKYSDGEEDYLFYKLEEGGNMVFLLGDNHSNARDSITFGPISVEFIKEIVVTGGE